MKITKKHILKLTEIVDAGLIGGAGSTAEPGRVCVEQAVCIALGYPFSDDPPCVSRALRSLKMKLNDCSGWSSNTARAKGLRKLAVVQIGSRDVLNDVEFSRRVAEQTIRQIVPRALRNAAKVCSPAHRDKLEAAAVRCAQEGTKESAQAARKIAADAADYAAATAAAAAAAYAATADAAAAATAAADYAAAYAAATATAAAADAADAAYAAADAADAAYAAAAAAAAAAAYAATATATAADAAKRAEARDAELIFFADMVLAILVDMKVPGVKYLKWIK